MPSSRNELYILLIASLAAGYTWLFINYTRADYSNNEIGICLIKHVTNIPCPSCGSTRSILSLLKGDFLDSLYWNPNGLILLVIMTIVPIWMTFDYYFGNDTLYNFYKKTDETLKQKRVAIPGVILILTNWIWNIYKGL